MTLTANELRVGNWVYNTLPKAFSNEPVNPFPIKVTCATFTALHAAEIEGRPLLIEPIPLTPELLEKAGFELDKEEYNLYSIPTYLLKEFVVRQELGEWIFIYKGVRNGIRYLHQLQNIYYSLTNNELNLNL